MGIIVYYKSYIINEHLKIEEINRRIKVNWIKKIEIKLEWLEK